MRGPAVLRGALGEAAGDSWGGGEGLGTCGGKLEDSWNHLEAGAGAPGNPAGGLLLQVRGACRREGAVLGIVGPGWGPL